MKSFPRWCLFFDFHTSPDNPDVGKNFNMEAIASRFAAAGAQYVLFPARCNQGLAYYDTQIGIKHPALQRDLLKELAEACHRKGILIAGYMNMGLSHEETLAHRDWLILDADGYSYKPDKSDPFFRQMCYNTGYGDHFVEMAREAMIHCNLDGMFFDCCHTRPCVGAECLDAMKAEGYDWEDETQREAYNNRKICNMARRVSEAVKAIRPDALIYFNGISQISQKDFGTYLELEVLPTGGWGYENLQVTGRFSRTLGKPCLNMTGRFHGSWGDFGGIRTEASVEYDLIYGLSLGLGCNIGDHFHPRGDINEAVAQLDISLYKHLQPLDPWLDNARPSTEMAIVMRHPYPGYDRLAKKYVDTYVKGYNAECAAARILCELKQQFDVVTTFSSWDKYDILILPDYVSLDDEIRQRLEKHLAKGGKIIASTWSGLPDKEGMPDENGDFVLPQWGVANQGKSPYNHAFFKPSDDFREGFPDMPNSLYEDGLSITAKEGAEVLATITKPYYNAHWNGKHYMHYIPPATDTDEPFVTASSQVAYASHPIFSIYSKCAHLPMRQIVANTLKRFLPEPMLKTPDAPAYVRTSILEQPGRRMVFFMSYIPEARGASCMIEEPVLLENQRIMLRTDGAGYKKAYLAPTCEELPLEFNGNYACVTLKRNYGWSVIVFEE